MLVFTIKGSSGKTSIHFTKEADKVRVQVFGHKGDQIDESLENPDAFRQMVGFLCDPRPTVAR